MSLRTLKSFFLLSSLFLILIFLSGCTFYQYIAHYANNYGWKTKLTIKNSSSSDATIALYFYNDNGNKVSNTTFTLPAYGFKTDYVENFFPDTLPDSGSIEIDSEEEGYSSKVSSIILFEHTNGKDDVCLAGLQGAQNPSQYLTFPWFENSSNYKTGIAILNVSGHSIVATMRAFDTDGNVTYSHPIKLDPMERIIGFPSDFFDTNIPSMSTLDVYGTGDMVGFIIMYNPDITKAEAINGVLTKNYHRDSASYGLNLKGEEFSQDEAYIEMSRDFNKLYVLAKDDGIYEFDSGDVNHGSKIFSLSPFSGKFDISPDSRRLAVVDWSSQKAYEINLDDNSSKQIDEFSVHPTVVSYSKDGNYCAMGTDNGDVSILNYDVLEHTYTGYYFFKKTGGYISDIIFSPDSKYLVAIDYNLGKLYYVNLTSKIVLNVEEKDLGISNPTDIEVGHWGDYFVCGRDYRIAYFSSLGDTPSYFTLPAGTDLWNIAVSTDERYLFGADGSSKILIYDTLTATTRTVDAGTNVYDLTYSRGDDTVYYAGKNLGWLH